MEEYRMIERTDVTGFLAAFTAFVRQVIRYILSSLRRYRYMSLAVFLLVSCAGLFYSYRKPLLYESEMACEFNNLSKKTYGEMLHKLDMLVKSQSWQALSATLHLPVGTVSGIASIEGRNMSGSALYEDVTVKRDPIYISAGVTDKDILIPLQGALLTYLNTGSPYRQLRNSMESAAVQQKMVFLRKDLSLTDSVIGAYAVFLRNIRAARNASAGLSNVSGLLSYKDKMEDKQIQQEWHSLELKQSVELLHGFIPPDHPVDKRAAQLPLWLIMAAAAACFLATLRNLSSSPALAVETT